MDQALRFARALASEDVTIVSGLARGIDEAGHRAALEAGGRTLAVLASGVDRPWPVGPLARQMAEQGLLLSEYPPGQGPRRHHFPLRNRLIAGLSLAVLVVEAAWTSGSLITARWAADQGKSVFVVPGRIDHPMALGIVRLLREGATPVSSPEELLADLFERPQPKPGGTPQLFASRHWILDALRGETLTADELARRCARPIDEVLVGLIELEVAGGLVRGPGGLWRRNPRA
jgi:DNA processing protein